MIAGRGGRSQAASPPAPPATIPGYLANHPLQSSAPSMASAAPVVTRNAAAAALTSGNGSTSSLGSTSSSAGLTTGPGAVTVVENPSSAPSSSVGNGRRRCSVDVPLLPSLRTRLKPRHRAV